MEPNYNDRLWYRQEACTWNEALPLGNGRLGAMVYGGARLERLSLNEDSLWSGSPSFYTQKEAPKYWAEARELAAKGVFIAESVNVIQSALDAGIKPVSLLCERRHAEGKAAGLIRRLGDVPVYAPSDDEIKKLTGYELSRGVLCEMERPQAMTPERALAGARACAVMEDVRDETNLGAIFRSAAALGMDAVMLCGGCSDPLSRRAARVSTGAVFRLPWARLPALSDGGAETLKCLGFTLCALALTDRSEEPDALRRTARPAVVLGNEGEGLSREAVACCDMTVRIPMRRGVDSLNVAAAAAIAFWEAGKRG